MAEAGVETVNNITADVSGETTKPVDAETTADISGDTPKPINGEVPKEFVENLEGIGLSEEYTKNPLLQPTNKTADEIVAEIMAEVSDEGVLSSLARMGELQDELESKIKNMQLSFEEQMASIQADIDKYWEIDKEYEQYHGKIDELCANDGEKPASQQIREMVEAFKEGKYKEGLEKVTAGDQVIEGVLTTGQATAGDSTITPGQNDQLQSGDSAVTTNGAANQNYADVSAEEVFEDASSEIVPSTEKVSKDQARVKSPKSRKASEETKNKNDELKGKKSPKKKGLKS